MNILEVVQNFQTLSKQKFIYMKIKPGAVSGVLKMFLEKYEVNSFIEDEIERVAYATREAIKAYRFNKHSAIEVLKELHDFLYKEHKIEIKVKFPSIDISNTFERQMYLAKVLQTTEKRIEDVQEELLVDIRTIESDLARLRGRTNDPIQILGRKFVIEDTQRSAGKLVFASTVHPLFLTLNLTQVIAMLDGLKAQSDNQTMRNYALVGAADIWNQLSDYARARVLYVKEELFNEDTGWYKSLADMQTEAYQTEAALSCTEGAGVVLDCLKNGKSFFAEYREPDGKTEFYYDCRCVPGTYRCESIDVSCDKGYITLIIDNILRSACKKEDLV